MPQSGHQGPHSISESEMAYQQMMEREQQQQQMLQPAPLKQSGRSMASTELRSMSSTERAYQQMLQRERELHDSMPASTSPSATAAHQGTGGRLGQGGAALWRTTSQATIGQSAALRRGSR
eukprot:357210-Chlamydomonas_euryale.AAC.4